MLDEKGVPTMKFFSLILKLSTEYVVERGGRLNLTSVLLESAVFTSAGTPQTLRCVVSESKELKSPFCAIEISHPP